MVYYLFHQEPNRMVYWNSDYLRKLYKFFLKNIVCYFIQNNDIIAYFWMIKYLL